MATQHSEAVLDRFVDDASPQTFLAPSQPSIIPSPEPETSTPLAPIVLSFDVEEHYRIEAAVSLDIDSGLKTHYNFRMETTTRQLLDTLAERDITATFFIVGEIARLNPSLVRDIHLAGHEVASHSWDHRRVHHFTPQSFAEDLRRSKDVLEDVIGAPVVGFRAPTFSLVRQTSWAVDVLAKEGFLYDSSIFPVRHDRYGIPTAPRTPFLLQGENQKLVELPPATLRFLGMNLPIGGGGYFRLFPLFFLNWALSQLKGKPFPAVATLYFHPWEFDPVQARLPLSKLSSFRTYVGLTNSSKKLDRLLQGQTFARAVDVARQLLERSEELPTFSIPT